MATTTSKHSFPVPSADGSDPPAGHTQIKALGDDIDSKWPVRSRGVSDIATEQATPYAGNENVYTMMGTPDRVQDVVLPSGGLILVHFRALVRYSALTGIGEAAIFLNGNQLKNIQISGAPSVQKVDITDTEYQWIWSTGTGLGGGNSGAGAASDGVTTGLAGGVFGPFCAIEAAAGTYGVSIRYRNTQTNAGANQVQAKNRRLRVWTMEF